VSISIKENSFSISASKVLRNNRKLETLFISSTFQILQYYILDQKEALCWHSATRYIIISKFFSFRYFFPPKVLLTFLIFGPDDSLTSHNLLISAFLRNKRFVFIFSFVLFHLHSCIVLYCSVSSSLLVSSSLILIFVNNKKYLKEILLS
jgi:hypothetical protein